MDYREHITIEPDKLSGKPCIRGLRITVYDVLDYLASGMSQEEILRDFPDPTPEPSGRVWRSRLSAPPDGAPACVRLLLDQNLSPRFVRALADVFPESTHVRDVGLSRATDEAVWTYAARHGPVIVSKEAEFQQRSFLLGHPPKVVWIRRGNCSTGDNRDVTAPAALGPVGLRRGSRAVVPRALLSGGV